MLGGGDLATAHERVPGGGGQVAAWEELGLLRGCGKLTTVGCGVRFFIAAVRVVRAWDAGSSAWRDREPGLAGDSP